MSLKRASCVREFAVHRMILFRLRDCCEECIFWITAVELISNPRTSIDVTRVSAARSRPCICRVSVALSEPNFERHGWFGKNT
jgi:hypothetical protein